MPLWRLFSESLWRHRAVCGARVLLVVTFAFVVGSTLLRHEMWHDELNSWDVARDAHTLPELFANMHYEAHPAIWYLCLYGTTRVTSDPRAMQAFHLLIATGTVILIATLSPFTIVERWLLAFGYFFVFEFAVISRGYALGVLLALVICAVYVRPKPSVALITLLLALLANTSLYGLFVAIALTAGFVVDGRIPRTRTSVVGLLVVAAAAALSLRTLYPAPDNAFAREWHRFNPTRVEGVLDLAWAAYVPLPDFEIPSPWNSSLFMEEAFTVHVLPRGFVAAVLGMSLLVGIAVALRRNRAAVTMHVIGAAMMLAFIYLKYSGGLRHHGHLFILLVAAVWIARRGVQPPKTGAWLASVLVCQVVAGAYFVVEDLRKPFSFSAELTDYVRSLPKPTPVVVAQHSFLNFAGPVLSGYLRRQVTYVLGHRIVQGSFMYPDVEHMKGATEEEIAGQLHQFARDRNSDVYVVTNNWSPPSFGPSLAHFDRHIEGDERFADVYLFRRAP